MRYLSSIALCLTLLPAVAGAATMHLEVRHLWEGKPLALESDEVTTKAGERLKLSRLAYLLSEPGLVMKDSNRLLVKKDWVAYVDAENPISELILTDLPPGSYHSLQFHIGLDQETDRSDPSQYSPKHPLNPLLNNLHWDPQGGYIFVALEGNADTGLGFSYHLGGADNRVLCQFPVNLEIDDTITVAIDFHLDRLFNGETPWETAGQTSTHSRSGDPVATRMKEGLPTIFTIRGVRRDTNLTGSDTNPSPDLIGTPYPFKVKRGFPVPNLPEDYPLTKERVDLGAALFHDLRLSKNNSLSCASCHQDGHAFSDPDKLSIGANGESGRRQSMPLFNLAWKKQFFWDGRANSLREQALMPIEDHLEMDESIENVLAKLSDDTSYPAQFEAAYGSSEISGERIGIAIEQFLLTITSYDSRFDQALAGSASLTEEEKRGFELFMTEFDPRRGLRGADCFHCHSGPFFSTHRFHNNGLALTDDTGLMEVTSAESDRGKFVTPSLRNVALTAPYMHDGRFSTLEEVVEHYASGIERSETLDPNLSKHPGPGIPLSGEDKRALVAFLHTLTDERFSDPSHE